MVFARSKPKKKKSILREYIEALLWALLLAAIIRVWGVQAFKIPSGSMKPTLLIGDHLLVSKSSYGVKLPLTDTVVIPVGDPERGDIVVFRFPEDRDKDFIKRIIGLPGDKIAIKDKMIFINGKKLVDTWGHYSDQAMMPADVQGRDNMAARTVPPGHYFVMGDNRDQSYDSRFWFGGKGGFVPREDILGKAFIIYWSWKGHSFGVRWDRIGTVIH